MTILVLAPHQDDECLQTAGIIRRAVTEKKRVCVCFATNGDYESDADSAVRAAESRTVLHQLGVKDTDIFFLGYPDTGMPYETSFLRRLYDGIPVTASRHGRRETATADCTDFRFLRDRVHSPFTAEAVRRDLHDLLCLLRPDEVYVTAPGDCHGDHDALGRFTREVIEASDLHPVLRFYPVHADTEDLWPPRDAVHFPLPAGSIADALNDCTLERIPLPSGFSTADKRTLISCYRSQDPSAYNNYLYAFAKEDELLFRAP